MNSHSFLFLLLIAEDIQKIVTLSTSSSVLSRYTAFVGVDQDGIAIKYTEPSTIYHEDMQCLRSCSMSRSRKFFADCKSLMKKKDKKRNAPVYKMAKKAVPCSAPAPIFEASNAPANCSSMDQSILSLEICQKEEMLDSCLEDEELEQERKIEVQDIDKAENNFILLISCQQFDGSWKWKDVLLLLQQIFSKLSSTKVSS